MGKSSRSRSASYFHSSILRQKRFGGQESWKLLLGAQRLKLSAINTDRTPSEAHLRFAICEGAAQVEYDARSTRLTLAQGHSTRCGSPMQVLSARDCSFTWKVKRGFGGRAPLSAKLTLRRIRPLKRRAA